MSTASKTLAAKLANAFLGWKLPKDFSPDCGISFQKAPERPDLNQWEYEPTGTNLFTSAQARAMFEYCLSAPEASADTDLNPTLEECIQIVDSYGPYGFDVNEEFRIKIALKDEVLRLRTQLADATRKLDEARKDAERLDFMWERQVTMYDQHPNYMPMCICFDDGAGERVTIVAQNLREAIDQAIEQGKGGDDE
jgi:hypothetical protein